MRRWVALMTILVASGFCPATASEPAKGANSQVPIGNEVGELRFVDIRGLRRNLSEMGEHRATVLMFTTTSCQLVKKYLPRLVELHHTYHAQGVLFVAVNVGAEDTIREMAAQAVDHECPFYFVKDVDYHCMQALGVRKTPEVVVLDAQRVLRYRGRIDDQMRLGGSKPHPSRNDLQLAIDEVLSGQPVSVTQTEVDGCLITQPAPLDISRVSYTWSEHIAKLIHQKCAHCHRPDTAAPFQLLTYADVSSNSEMIAEVVRFETMPPWYASRDHGHFQNDFSLSADQKRMLLAWIAAGCPEGTLSDSPQPPEFPTSEWRIGEPDLIITMAGEHRLPATGFVPYKYVILPHIFLTETWVEAFEIKPLNPAVVHHCNMAYMSTKDGAGLNTFITGYVPGGQPMDAVNFDNGVAYRIPAQSVLVLQIHYTTTGREEAGRIQVGLRFPRREVKKSLRFLLLDPRGWAIPPRDHAYRVESFYTLPCNANLLGLFTHMHVRGKDMTFFATPPDGPSETLLQIPNYNFEWQLGYELSPGQKVFPKGTQIRAVGHFDNSLFNPYNPDPDDTVLYGPQTIHEMFNGFVFYVDQDEELSIRVDPTNGRVVEP